MIIVAGIAGICLWGLSELLDSLKQPGLLRTDKAVVVKGCASLENHPDAPQLCPQLLCQKALIERKFAARDARFAMHATELRGAQLLVGGTLVDSGQGFACTLVGLKVTAVQLLDAASGL